MIDLNQMKQHLEEVVRTFQSQGLRYGSATFTTPEGLEENKVAMGLAAFLTILEALGCIPWTMTVTDSSYGRAIVTSVDQGLRQAAKRHTVYFRFMDPDDSSVPEEPREHDA